MIEKPNSVIQGKINKREIIDLLQLNDRWFSIADISGILNITHTSARSHCQNLTDSGKFEETRFYKHGCFPPRAIIHYRFVRD